MTVIWRRSHNREESSTKRQNCFITSESFEYSLKYHVICIIWKIFMIWHLRIASIIWIFVFEFRFSSPVNSTIPYRSHVTSLTTNISIFVILRPQHIDPYKDKPFSSNKQVCQSMLHIERYLVRHFQRRLMGLLPFDLSKVWPHRKCF